MLPSARARVMLLQQEVADSPASASARYALSAALAETGDHAAAAEVFRSAFLLDPGGFSSWLRQPANRAAATASRDRAADLISRGAAFSYAIGWLAVAEARLGHVDAVKKLVDYESFFRCTTFEQSGSSDFAFHSTLAAEIRSDLRYYEVPANRAIRRGWRHDRVLEAGLPGCQALRLMITESVRRYMAQIATGSSHPFLDACPRDFHLEGWAVVSDGKSHHLPHIHPRAWASGVYYVVQPPVSRDTRARRGWLRIGAPEHHGVTSEQGWAERWVEPAAGTLVLMPGYFFHGTQPMGVDEDRICVAFDVVPAEIVPAAARTTDINTTNS